MQKYVVLLEKRASKNIDKLSSVDRKRVNEDLFTLRDKGFSQELDIKKLQGYRNHYKDTETTTGYASANTGYYSSWSERGQ